MARLLLTLALLLLLGLPMQRSLPRDASTACQSSAQHQSAVHSAPVRKKYYYTPNYRSEAPRRRVYVHQSYHRNTGPYHPRLSRRHAPSMDEELIQVDEDDGIEIDDDGIEIDEDDGIVIDDDDVPGASTPR